MQPAPVTTPQSVAVLPHVVDFVLTCPGVAPETAAELVRRVRQRSDKGLETYGARLHTYNGRDAALDAEEEALDLVQYAVQNVLEGRYRWSLVRRVVLLAAELIEARTQGPG